MEGAIPEKIFLRCILQDGVLAVPDDSPHAINLTGFHCYGDKPE